MCSLEQLNTLSQMNVKRLTDLFEQYQIRDNSTISTFINYLAYGLSPGSFSAAVIANDFYQAIKSSHPANSIIEIKYLVQLITERFPTEAYGSWEKYNNWIALSDLERRELLEFWNLILTPIQETVTILQDSK